MIAVIADDFTGAAEIAGVGLRYGLRVEIDSNHIKNPDADLLIIATDTRSKNKAEAYNEVKRITNDLLKKNVDWIYKKTDSVLRGNVLSELRAILEAMRKDKVLLVPSNPAYDRIIKNGIYYVDNQPVHLTGFADDPEYSHKSSNVIEMLGKSNKLSTHLVSRENKKLPEGISVADASTLDDLDFWSKRLTTDIIPAGAAGFFISILRTNGYKTKNEGGNHEVKYGQNFLFICGSAFSHGRIAVEEARMKGARICEMPDDVFYYKKPFETHFKKWVEDTCNSFNDSTKVIVEINQPVIKEHSFARRLRTETAKFVDEVIKNVRIDELFIDGGATAYAIAQRLKLDKFLPCQEIAPGVIRMKVERNPHLHVTIKPGSYSWPEEVWKFD